MNGKKTFVSYERASHPLVERLVEDIENLGHSAWFDPALTGGDGWWDTILDKIVECDVFVLTLTEAALKSRACQLEWEWAAALCKPIVPVLLSDTLDLQVLPDRLAGIQAVDYRQADDRNAPVRLSRALARVQPLPLPTTLPGRPPAPLSPLGQLAAEIRGAAELSGDRQGALLLDLKDALGVRKTEQSARTLLQELRQRPEILARVAREIDGLTAATKPGRGMRIGSRPIAATAIAFVSVAVVVVVLATPFLNGDSPPAEYYEQPGGYLVAENGVWLETSKTDSSYCFLFEEAFRDKNYIVVADLARYEGARGNYFQMRIPLAGGTVEWSFINPVVWTPLYIVRSIRPPQSPEPVSLECLRPWINDLRADDDDLRHDAREKMAQYLDALSDASLNQRFVSSIVETVYRDKLGKTVAIAKTNSFPVTDLEAALDWLDRLSPDNNAELLNSIAAARARIVASNPR